MEIHHAGPSGWDTPRVWFSEVPEGNHAWDELASTELITRAEFEAYTKKDRRHERFLILAGAAFDLMVVLLAAERWLW